METLYVNLLFLQRDASKMPDVQWQGDGKRGYRRERLSVPELQGKGRSLSEVRQVVGRILRPDIAMNYRAPARRSEEVRRPWSYGKSPPCWPPSAAGASSFCCIASSAPIARARSSSRSS